MRITVSAAVSWQWASHLCLRERQVSPRLRRRTVWLHRCPAAWTVPTSPSPRLYGTRTTSPPSSGPCETDEKSTHILDFLIFSNWSSRFSFAVMKLFFLLFPLLISRSWRWALQFVSGWNKDLPIDGFNISFVHLVLSKLFPGVSTCCSPVGEKGEESSPHPGSAPVRSPLLPDLAVKKFGRHHPRQDAQTDRERERT